MITTKKRMQAAVCLTLAAAVSALGVCAVTASATAAAAADAADVPSAYTQGARELLDLGVSHVSFVDASTGEVIGGVTGDEYRYLEPTGS
jgi:hypothetical protein